jgi:hypothetical protein
MEPFKYQWVIRYHLIGKPETTYTFAGYKKNGNPSYTEQVNKIKTFRLYKDAFDVAKELIGTEKYIADVYRICAGRNDHYYFIKG